MKKKQTRTTRPKKLPIQVLIHASEVLTGVGLRSKEGRRPVETDLGRIEDGAVVYEKGGQILWVGPTQDLPKSYKKFKAQNLKNQKCVIPGLIDAHTHLVFAGNRADEFALRCGGMSYEEIAKRGGGITSTVTATRAATRSELLRLAIPRVKKMMSYGVRTIEIKSGYGLARDAEIKILEVVQDLQKKFPEVTFVSTYLGAHAFPKDQSRENYIQEIIEDHLPEVARRKLASSCDVFMDEGYYNATETEQILKRARELGLATRLHADELATTGATELAVKYQALSADHLLKVSHAGIQALARSKTVAVLLPGTAFYLKAQHAPARQLLSAGVRVALATDFNPGTCMIPSLPMIMTIAALYLGMTRAELFAAVTLNAAAALGLEYKKGTLEPGMDSDLTILPHRRFEECYYSVS